MSRGGRQWPVTDHDVLCGRGVSISQHAGNERFRALVLASDYSSTYSTTKKKAIAEEIVDHINNLDPPGRFLKRIHEDRKARSKSNRSLTGEWEELSKKEAIKKTCQALRDCNRRDRIGYSANVLMPGNLPPDVEEVRQMHAESSQWGKGQVDAKATATTKRKTIEETGDIFASLPTIQDLETPEQPIATTERGSHCAASHPATAEFTRSLEAIHEPRSSFKKQRQLPEVTPNSAATLGVPSIASTPIGSSVDDFPSVFEDTPSFDPLSGFELAAFDDHKQPQFGDSKLRASSFDDSKPRASSIEGLDVDAAYASFSAHAPQDFGPPSPPYDPDHPSYHES